MFEEIFLFPFRNANFFGMLASSQFCGEVGLDERNNITF